MFANVFGQMQTSCVLKIRAACIRFIRVPNAEVQCAEVNPPTF
jgi:hypothetical protein